MTDRYVALGDSSTEGLDDPYDDGAGWRGWADRLAEQLAAARPGLEYANLAVRGRLVRQVLDEQLAPALALRPTIATVFAGVNDALRPAFDLAGVVADLETVFGALAGAGATVLTITAPDPSSVMPLAERVAPPTASATSGSPPGSRRRSACQAPTTAGPAACLPSRSGRCRYGPGRRCCGCAGTSRRGCCAGCAGARRATRCSPSGPRPRRWPPASGRSRPCRGSGRRRPSRPAPARPGARGRRR